MFQYDAAGNRTQKVSVVSGTASTENAVPMSASNRLQQLTDGSGTVLRTFVYRGDGELVWDTHSGGPAYKYGYNARERVGTVTKDGTQIASYLYDFHGDPVVRTITAPAAQSYRYVRDQDGHILAVHDGGTNALLREYVWLDDLPVALIDSSSGTPATYYIVTGFVDEPMLMTNGSGGKVWGARLLLTKPRHLGTTSHVRREIASGPGSGWAG